MFQILLTTLPIYLMILVGYAAAGIPLALLSWSYSAERMRAYLISDDPHRSRGGGELSGRIGRPSLADVM